ncbi:zinc ribbon domain-containing protein [Streptomyces sp. NPDC017260]|uniref:zinc ribbon domain-containing protein n=1 Tax=unclassified Streptomyces TaxID=2593676 RepID=UPI0037AF732F
MLRRRTAEKASGRVEDVPAPYTSPRCSACGWIEKNSRQSQAEFVCVSCGFACNADENAAVDVAAGQGGIFPPPACSRCRRGDSGHQSFERP